MYNTAASFRTSDLTRTTIISHVQLRAARRRLLHAFAKQTQFRRARAARLLAGQGHFQAQWLQWSGGADYVSVRGEFDLQFAIGQRAALTGEMFRSEGGFDAGEA